MEAPSRDLSISPMTRSPQASTSALDRGERKPASIRGPNGSASALDRSDETANIDGAMTGSSIRQDTGEAADYLNGGFPHDTLSPGFAGHHGLQDETSSGPALAPMDGSPAGTSGERDPTLPPGLSTPSRRSVQFARKDVVFDLPSPQYPHARSGSWDGPELAGRSRGERIMSKLKSLAAANTSQSPRSPGLADQAGASATSSPAPVQTEHANEEGSDADVEESGDEEVPSAGPRQPRRRRVRRPHLRPLEFRSSPGTPRFNSAFESPFSPNRFALIRRSTMPDAADHRGGLSEGEGRDHLTGANRRRAFGRGTSWIGGTGRHDNDDGAEGSHARNPNHRRRISEFLLYGGASDGEGQSTSRRPFFGAERAATFGAQRWRQVKNTLRMFGKRKVDHIDFAKSAELMSELIAGGPVAILLASALQRDERGNKRIPVLLEQLNLKVVDSQPAKGDKESGHNERHSLFTIALEYGSGDSRMRWTVERSIKDIIKLHARYKLSLNNNDKLATLTQKKGPKQPHFPFSAFPYLRGFRGMADSDEEDEKALEEKPDETSKEHPLEAPEERSGEAAGEATAGGMTAPEETGSEGERPPQARRKRSRVNLLGPRRGSIVGNLAQASKSDMNLQKSVDNAAARKRFTERQRTLLEKYLQNMIRWLMFRADSNRLCEFLELSALGVRLAAEGSYHGKECYLHIQSSKGIDFRRVYPSRMIARHTRKWFMIRQSYIVVVDSASNMNIYDVYLVDPDFRIIPKKKKLKQLGAKAIGEKDKRRGNAKGKNQLEDDDDDDVVDEEDRATKHHSLTICSKDRKVKLFSGNQNLIRQFEQSIAEMLKRTKWAEQHRFASFAPVRTGVFAQWLVDGRDYMWNVSRAISMAQDVIYIHDWWLSPELYMRRPAAISQKWRLDRLLQRKAQQGVKVFVIIYRNVEQAVPIDSEYTKFALLNLHPNIMVQRSPNQLKKNQFFYAHHEKIVIVDHDVAFVGGIDLCFGRWDSPQHPLTDDRPTGFEPDGDTPKDAEHCQLFPGKDYSNPRVLDFFNLHEPYEEMYDRSKTPRMPWHDIAMQVVGQPARDLTRHFVQRWNYLRRERRPTRPMPFLLPPPDANHADLESVGLTGTCEVQIVRSAGDWSLGFPKNTVEQSIQSAYVKLIQQSEHFVYLENQFFISSTETMNTKVVNRIGDAIVERIMRAAENDEEWRCCIVIPLMPGFQNTVDQDSGSSVRLIMQFQYRTICRGPNSIFGRLQAAGIDPEEYIQFFSLRQWGKLNNGQLVTEQLYIHAKTIIVDDRVVLIGSANINERSMLGLRDSEVAAIVRDTDMIWSTMGGEPYRVGRFAHTLRMRLMREHLGLDVDEITEEERAAAAEAEAQYEAEMDQIYGSDVESPSRSPTSATRPGHARYASFNNVVEAEDTDTSSSSSSSSSSKSSKDSHEMDPRVTGNKKHKEDLEGVGADHWKDAQARGIDSGRDSLVIGGREVLVSGLNDTARPGTRSSAISGKSRAAQNGAKGNDKLPPIPLQRQNTEQLGLVSAAQLPTLPIMDDTDIGGPPVRVDASGNPTTAKINPLAADIQQPLVDKDCMKDPVNPAFWDDIWCKVAANNTKLYRRVFRCNPDSEVTTWKEYQEFEEYSARFKESMVGRKKSDEHEVKPTISQIGNAAAGVAAPSAVQEVSTFSEKTPVDNMRPPPTPKVKVSSGDGSWDEKKPLPPLPPVPPEKDAQLLEKPKLSLDVPNEKTNGNGSLHNPSPIQPFPALDGHTDGTHLEPQAPTLTRSSSNSASYSYSHSQNNSKPRRATFSSQSQNPPSSSAGEKPLPPPGSSHGGSSNNPPPPSSHGPGGGSTRRRRRATTKGSSRRGGMFPYEVLSREEAEDLCGMIQGALVQFPYDWLESEERDNHWLYQADLLAPKEIYD